MSVSYRIEIEDKALRALLQRMIARGEDLAPAMDEIGRTIVDHTILRFERGVSPAGVPWKPSLRAREEGGRTLIDTARLRNSITHRATRDGVTVGTNVVYARVHQLGATIKAKSKPFLSFRIGKQFVRKKSVTVPARPFIGLDAADRADIPQILRRHLLGGAA